MFYVCPYTVKQRCTFDNADACGWTISHGRLTTPGDSFTWQLAQAVTLRSQQYLPQSDHSQVTCRSKHLSHTFTVFLTNWKTL